MTYTDHYPNGRPYEACGAPHPSGELFRRCSRSVGHLGTATATHINRVGNEWTLEQPCTAVVYATGSPAPCGLPWDAEWIHYNRDDSRAIDHEYEVTP